MKCTILSAIVFLVASIFYGASYAIVDMGLKYFSAGVFQAFRMFFGLCFSSLILLARYIINKNGYRQTVRAHFTSGWMPILHLVIGGLMNLGVSHCLIAVAQQWVNSASVQMMQPFATAAGAIFAHFALPDEKFTMIKLYSVLLSAVGVVLTGIPSFLHSGDTGASIGNMALGYFLVIISICMFGIATVYFKWKTPNCDVTCGVVVQLIASVVWNIIWALCFDGPSNIKRMLVEAPPIAWAWPVIVGCLVSGVAVHCLLYLVTALGSFGSNLVPFGQIVVGVITGVAFMGDWDNYTWWEILLCCLGCVFLIGSLVVGFFDKNQGPKGDEDNKEEEEEHKEEPRREDEELEEL